ncbi:MAG TPA: GntR family transcriptional regulator [Longimicrobium sp.]|nr:GntR family transcriptional regulator [Longimicrobium sp.]
MRNGRRTERHLRYFILGQLHVGHLKPGDPLPSIRQVAKETGADHRTVANAYRVLEAEGLVEIRPGAGVYLAGEGSAAIRSETGHWLTEVMLEGWSRRISRGKLRTLVDRCAGTRVRCACIESNEDHMVAVSAELAEDFSLDVQPVLVSPSAEAPEIPRTALTAADLVVTTVFHAAAGRAAAAAAGKPCIVATLNPQFAAEVNRRLLGGEVTAVIVDPRFSARAAAYLDVTAHRDRVRFLLVDQLGGAEAGPLDLRSENVLVTRAARRRLRLPDYHLVPSPPTFISPESARELAGAIVALGLHAT